MSNLKPSPVDNESIIDEVTKDLQATLIEPDKEDTDQNYRKATSNNADFDAPFEDAQDSPETPPETPKLVNEETDSEDEDDHKDEDQLTNEEKESKRDLAEKEKLKGNELLMKSSFKDSLEAYTLGLKICPLQYTRLRSILYSNRSAVKIKMEDHKSAIKDCTKSIKLDERYIKSYLRRALCYEKTDNLEDALADYKKILEIDPREPESLKAMHRLPPLIEERNEKMKTEMFAKLKDLGNLVLRPFGLSTDNFQLEQDPESKGYKINFKQ